MGTIRIRTGMKSARTVIGNGIASAFKELLEGKHLYQSVILDVTNVVKEALQYEEDTFIEAAVSRQPIDYEIEGRYWDARYKDGNVGGGAGGGGNRNAQYRYSFSLPNIKMYCRSCKRDEPFMGTAVRSQCIDFGAGIQLFVMSFLCQSCSEPQVETFIVNRQGVKLKLCGRTPMEEGAVQKAFPKKQAKFISAATIAHNAGQTLAGLFFLRTFIEQYVTAETKKRIDDGALEEYKKLLPENIKSEMPSLLDIYGKLSEAIHEADANADLFADMKQQLELHFDARKVMEKLSKYKVKADVREVT